MWGICLFVLEPNTHSDTNIVLVFIGSTYTTSQIDLNQFITCQHSLPSYSFWTFLNKLHTEKTKSGALLIA